MNIKEVLHTHRELVEQICSGGAPLHTYPSLALEPDYAYVIEHFGALRFRDLDLDFGVGNRGDFPVLTLPRPDLEMPDGATCCYYLVGTSYGGDDAIQICVGQHKGALAYFDHEIMDWYEVQRSELYRRFRSANEKEQPALFDALLKQWQEADAIVISETSLAEAIDAAFSSYSPAHEEFHTVSATIEAITPPYLRVLVNSLEHADRTPGGDPVLELLKKGEPDMGMLIEMVAKQTKPFVFLAMSEVEAAAIIHAYETYVQPRFSMLRTSAAIFGFVDQSYWLRGLCYTIDAYLIEGQHPKLEPHLPSLRTLLSSLAVRRGGHILSLRIAAVWTQLGRFDEALEVLEATSFTGFKRDLESFRNHITTQDVFAPLRQAESERLLEVLQRDPPSVPGPGGVWGYHGSTVFDDLRDLPANLEQEIGPPHLEGNDGSVRHRQAHHHASAKPGEVALFFSWEPTDLHPGFWKPSMLKKHGAFCGVTVQGSSIYLTGGLGMNMAFESHDAGDTFCRTPLFRRQGDGLEAIKVRDISGLRYLLVEGDTRYLAAQFGKLLRSHDGHTYENLETGATSVLNSLFRVDGALWATGDSGAYRSHDDGETWQQVDVEGEITRPHVRDGEAVLPSSEGYLYLTCKGLIHKTALAAPAPLWAACRSPRGTLLAVGKDGIYRSTDDGASFAKTYSSSKALQNLACLSDDVVIVIGQGGVILRSADDGASFELVPQSFTDSWLFGIAVYQDQALIAGAEGLVLIAR